MDVKELGQLDAEHVCGQSDGTPPSLTHLPEPGPSPPTEDNPDRVVKHRDPGTLSWHVWLPSQAASPALAPPASDATTDPDPPPHWKHCGDTQHTYWISELYIRIKVFMTESSSVLCLLTAADTENNVGLCLLLRQTQTSVRRMPGIVTLQWPVTEGRHVIITTCL